MPMCLSREVLTKADVVYIDLHSLDHMTSGILDPDGKCRRISTNFNDIIGTGVVTTNKFQLSPSTKENIV